MGRKVQLIPHSAIQTLMRQLREVTEYVQISCAIPPVAYKVRYVLFFIALFIPGLVTEDVDLWKEGRATTKMFKFISFFAFWGSIFGRLYCAISRKIPTGFDTKSSFG